MNRKWFLVSIGVLTLGLTLLLVTGIAAREPSLPAVDLTPIADAYVALSAPNTPFGVTDPNNLNTHGSRGTSGSCNTTRQTLVKFDVSPLSTDVVSASLSLQRTQYTGPASGWILGVWPVADGWDELTVTWNTRPISGGTPLSTKLPPMPGPSQPLIFPSTAALVAYINSQRPANGRDGLASFAWGYVDCPLLSAPHYRNDSKENPSNLSPLLSLELGTPPTSTPGPSLTPTVPPTDTPTDTPVPTNTPTPVGALAAVADAYVALVYPNTPFGVDDPDYLKTNGSRGISGPCVTTRQTLVKFDVATLSADVTTATLWLQGTAYTGPTSSVVTGIWALGDGWDELTVTWNTRPISSGAPLSTKSSPMPPAGAPLVFPSTAALAAYVNSQHPANGGDGLASFVTGVADCPPLSAPSYRVASKDNPANLPPLLNVEYGPPLACALSAAKSGNNVALTWTAASGATSYRIYRGTTPYFTPGVPYATTSGLTYTDVGAIGDPATNHYYQVGATNSAGETFCTNRVGEFDFALQPGAPGESAIDDIAIALDVSATLPDAESLADWIETEGGAPFGAVRQVVKFDAASQTIIAWSHEFGFGDNFPLNTGDYIFLIVDENAPSLASFVGDVPAPGAVNFALTPGNPSLGCVMNLISLPLDHPEITDADLLADSIGAPNPPGPPTTWQVLDWLAHYQVFVGFTNLYNYGSPFATTVGYPYVVCLDETAPPSWP
jgi:hypothetical protein